MQQIVIEDTLSVEPVAKVSDDDYWTTAEAANFLGKSERTIRRLLQTGVLNGYKVAGPYGMVWKVRPVESVSVGGASGVVDELIAEYQAREEKIDALGRRVYELEEQLKKISALYENALVELSELKQTSGASVAAEQVEQSQSKISWWNIFKIPASLKPANAGDIS